MRRGLVLLTMFALAWGASARPAAALGCILVGCDCTVTATDIAFDPINPLETSTDTADGQILIQCTGLVSVGAGVTVQLDDGLWGTFAARRMRSDAGEFVSYNIFRPTPATGVWGDGTGGSQSLVVNGGGIVLFGWSATRTVPAVMTVTPETRPDDYTDTVVVRVIW